MSPNVDYATLNKVFNMSETTGENRDIAGRWVKGVSGNPKGLAVMTEEERLEKKIKKQAQEKAIETFTQVLAEVLPEIAPILIAKAKEGDMNAIKEINDRVMGKARQSVGIDGGLDEDNKPLPLLAYERAKEIIQAREGSDKSDSSK